MPKFDFQGGMPKGEKFPEGHGKIDMKFREG